MSGATYRIDVTYDPQNDVFPWDARVYRVSDDRKMWFTFGKTKAEAAKKARSLIARATESTDEGMTLYVDEQGQDAPLHSVKV